MLAIPAITSLYLIGNYVIIVFLFLAKTALKNTQVSFYFIFFLLLAISGLKAISTQDPFRLKSNYLRESQNIYKLSESASGIVICMEVRPQCLFRGLVLRILNNTPWIQ